MAALDFPNSPTTNQQYAAPNGVTYQYDGAAWVVSGGPPGQLWTGGTGTLTPTDTTKQVVVPGPTTTDVAPLKLGSRTVKSRIGTQPAADWVGMTLNARNDGTNYFADDTTRPMWMVDVNGVADMLYAQRAPAPGAGSPAWVSLLTLDNSGSLSINNVLSAMSAVYFNQTNPNAKASLINWSTTGVRLAVNDAYSPPVVAQGSWDYRLDTAASITWSWRAANAGAGAVTNVMTLDNAGNLTISGATATKASGTTWANPSDRRLKDDIMDYATGLAAIVALSPRTFVYNGKGGSTPEMRGYGFIADEVAPVMPEMVGTTQTKLNPDDEHDTEINTLDTSNLVLALVNAVKELAARLAAVETHV